MNYLAHLFLAESHAASRVGNLLGDFVTGTPPSLQPRFPRDIVAGIVRHRTLDAWTDGHAVTARLKQCISPERRRFAGAIIDIFHDHFLARHWAKYATTGMSDFLQECYTALLTHRELLPPGLGEGLEERIANQWLSHYGDEEALEDLFARMSRRRPAFAPLRESVEDLRAHRGVFEEGFTEFFPEIMAHTARLGPEGEALAFL